ncbi:MAG: hypothetical protein RLZ55_1666 [Actinomycetota bacterium]
MTAQLPLTGERTVPGIAAERYWFLRHEAVYRWLLAGPLGAVAATGAVVVDAGAGEGYGADAMAAAGAHAIALDYDGAAASHIAATYPRVAAIRCNLAALPLLKSGAAAVVSLQVIEHLWDLGQFLGECRRVLADGGPIVLSTPNRPVFSPGLGRGAKPTNPFHVEEFDADQVAGMLRHAGFADVRVEGLHHAGAIAEWETEHGSIVEAHVVAALTGEWSAELVALLPTLTLDDFVFGSPDGAHDLIGMARR